MNSLMLRWTALLVWTYIVPISAVGLSIHFHRYATPGCDGITEIGSSDRLRNNHCKNWPKARKFVSFSYNRWDNNHESNRDFWMYDLPDCNVAIYSEKNCKGERYIMGNYPSTEGKCGSDFGFLGASVGVACDKQHPWWGVGCATYCPGNKFDFQTQVDALPFKHNYTELECCSQPGGCTANKMGTTWAKNSCVPPDPTKTDGKTPGSRDRLQVMKYDREWRDRMQAELKKSEAESRAAKEREQKKLEEAKKQAEEHQKKLIADQQKLIDQEGKDLSITGPPETKTQERSPKLVAVPLRV